MLVAFNSAPGTLARDATEGFSPYAKALAEMIREGDLIPAVLFDRVRLRVHELTKGAQIPGAPRVIDTPFKFFEELRLRPQGSMRQRGLLSSVSNPCGHSALNKPTWSR